MTHRSRTRQRTAAALAGLVGAGLALPGATPAAAATGGCASPNVTVTVASDGTFSDTSGGKVAVDLASRLAATPSAAFDSVDAYAVEDYEPFFGGAPNEIAMCAGTVRGTDGATHPAAADPQGNGLRWSGGVVKSATFTAYDSNPAASAPPYQVSARPLDHAALVTWKAPTNGSRGAVTSYTVTLRGATGAVRTTTVAAPATSATVGDLVDGTVYSATVRATNAAGTSAPSLSVTATAGVPRDVLAVTGPTGHLLVRDTAGPSWADLGGTLSDAPAVVRARGRVFFVGLGTDHNVYVRTTEQGWHRLGPIGTRCHGMSAAADDAALHVSCRGDDRQLYTASTPVADLAATALPTLPGWHGHGGLLGYGTASVVVNGGLQVVVVGTDHQLYVTNGTSPRMAYVRAPFGPACYGTFTLAPDLFDGACVLSSGSIAVTDAAAGDGRTYRTVPAVVAGLPLGVTTDRDGSARYWAVGTDGALYRAGQGPVGGIAGWSRYAGGMGSTGVAALSLS